MRREAYKLISRGRALLAAFALMTAWSTQAAGQDVEDHPNDGEAIEREHQLHSEAERRLRTFRAVALAERLDLDEKQALALNAAISRYDEKRRRVRAEIASHMRVLRQAAKETNPDEDAVSGAIEGVLSGRARLEEIRQEEARELLANLDPARQARLVLFFADFPRDVRRLMHEGSHRGRHRRIDVDSPPSGEPLRKTPRRPAGPR